MPVDKTAMRIGASVIALTASSGAWSQDRGLTYTTYGTPGLIEMPHALSAADGEFATTLALLDGQQRTTLTFQITERLSGSFRLAATADFSLPGDPLSDDIYIGRGVDLRYTMLNEGPNVPAVAIGLQDFLGSAQYGAEYIVLTKTVSDQIRLTAGLGWGRLGSREGIGNPFGAVSDDFDTRPATDDDITSNQYFRGDAALFGGVEWAFSDDWTLKAEYSSDDYARESALGIYDAESPFNVGLTWEPLDGVQIGASYLYGTTFGLTGTILLNPNDRPYDGGFDRAPVPVAVRDASARAATGWNRDALPVDVLGAGLAQAMAADGLILNAIEVTDRTARIRYTNTRYRSEAQAMGRVARMMTQGLPPSIELITFEPMREGIPMSGVTLRRSDLESLETEVGGSDALLSRAQIGAAGTDAGLVPVSPLEGRFDWGLGPYLGLVAGTGDPDADADGVLLEGGAEVSASYRLAPGLVLSGAVRQQLFNTADDARFVPDDDVPGLYPVRRNAPLYAQEGTTTIPTLTLAHYGHLMPDLYSRVTVGLLEPMYGGLSTELLYKPVNADWAIGAEVNHAVQRDFDQTLEFRDYDVTTAYLSAYYDFDNGFFGQIDVGRYLAGDVGATLTVDRAFENGWRIGASATLTEASEMSLADGVDYGIRLTIPIDFVLGQPTQQQFSTTVGGPLRDDGARLDIDGRLYETVRAGQRGDLEDGWGRFWR